MQRGRLLRCALERLHLRSDRVPDLQRPLDTLDLERDRCLFHRDDLADELGQVSDRAAELPGPYIEQCLLLFVRRPVVDVDDDPPVSIEDVPRNVREDHERASGHVRAVDRPTLEVPGEHAVAGAAVGILPHPARAEDVAGADLEQTAFQLVSHLGHLLA